MSRHGAWLTFGNVDLHLIKGKPAVHADDDLIVSHIAITVTDMDALKKRMEQNAIGYRTNISVPNPADSDTGRVEQAFVRDPDGYYIEFCNCEKLEKFLHKQMADYDQRWNFQVTSSVLKAAPKLKQFSAKTKKKSIENVSDN